MAAGDAVVAPRVTRRLLDTFARHLPTTTQASRDQRLAALTERERGVLETIALGQSNQEIAASLCLSEATVKSHVSRILAKLGLRDRVQAVIFAYERDWSNNLTAVRQPRYVNPRHRTAPSRIRSPAAPHDSGRSPRATAPTLPTGGSRPRRRPAYGAAVVQIVSRMACLAIRPCGLGRRWLR